MVVRLVEAIFQGSLIPRPEYKRQSLFLLERLRDSAPVFDKTTEEGLRFRIYRLGSLEIRTTQALHQEEIIGSVFSIRNQAPTTVVSKLKTVDEQENVIKVMEYVERVFVPSADVNGLSCRYYIVLETEHGNKILTERLDEGQLSWVRNPEDLEDRSSLAKLIRSETCTGVIVRDMMRCWSKMAQGTTPSSKQFARAMLTGAAGTRCTSSKDMKPFCFKH